ncbi:hypothetical protein JOC61_001993, partial [Marinitoga litoralis]|nr:hypothetical protein [Marinitoga litoralis]
VFINVVVNNCKKQNSKDKTYYNGINNSFGVIYYIIKKVYFIKHSNF